MKKIWEICDKLDKMQIKDWGTIEKIQRKLEKVFVLSNIYWNFEKKIKGISGETSQKF